MAERLEWRLRELLRRLGEADRALRDTGRDPEPFLLIYGAGGAIGIKHPTWDISWPSPTAEDVDDLVELGFARLEPATNVKRIFALTVRGRQQAALLDQAVGNGSKSGRVPPVKDVLAWLLDQERTAPESFEVPTRLLDAAVTTGFIGDDARGTLASSHVRLMEEGYLAGDLPDFQQASDEQRLGLSSGLSLTMKAHGHGSTSESPRSGSVNFFAPVVAGQIASGDITNFVSFADVLDRARDVLEELDDVDDSAREEAQTLVELLRGRAVDLSASVLTGAGGGLLATVLGQLIGLEPPPVDG